MTKKIILSLNVVLLFIFCISKTYNLLGIGRFEKPEEEINVQEIVDDRTIINNSNPNMYQDEDTGMRLFDGNFIYYNSPNYLMKYDVYSGKEQPLAANISLKCMTDAGDDIYGVITMMSGSGIDSDYLVKIAKDNGNITVFYKTECPHITSVSFDGEYTYYTNESHTIYQLDNNENLEWASGKSSADYPIIIGISDGNMIITDGTQIESIAIKTKSKKTVYNQLCSEHQKPIMNGEYIYMYKNFKQDSIIELWLKSGKTQEIISSEFVNSNARADKIDSFSISDGMLSFNCEGRLYVKKDGEPPSFCQYMTSLESSSFNGYLFYLDEEKVNVLDAFNK